LSHTTLRPWSTPTIDGPATGLPLHRVGARAIVGAALLTILVGCGAPQRAGPTLSPLQRAQQALDQGRLREADEAIRPDADAGDLDAILLAAEIAMRGGQYAVAVSRLERARAQRPDDDRNGAAPARAHDGAGNPDEAMRAYADVLRKHPDDVGAALRLAELLLGQGNAALASSAAAAALKNQPNHGPLLAVYARALLARGRLPQALEAAKRATEVAPAAPAGWLELARVQAAMGEHAAAIAHLERLLAIDANHVHALILLGTLRLEGGKPALAVLALQRAAAIAADDVAILNLLAVALDANGDARAALEVLERAIALAPRLVALRRNVAEILLSSGYCERAFDEAARAVDLARSQSDDAGNADRVGAEETLARTIVVRALVRAACALQRDVGAVRAAIAHDLHSAGLHLTEEAIDRAAVESKQAVQRATATCRPGTAAPGGTP